MPTLEEDLQYVLDMLHKLAFAALTPGNAAQLRDAAQCISDIRDASAIAQEVIWILEDNPAVERFDVSLRNGKAIVENLVPAEGEHVNDELASVLSDRLSHVVRLCAGPERVNGWGMQGDRKILANHLDARRFDAAAVLALVAPEWAEQLIHRIDQATAHHEMLHSSRKRLRVNA